MKKWLRRIRGALRMGLTWAVAWSPIGVIFGLVALVRRSPLLGGGLWLLGGLGLLVVGALVYGVMGFLGGAAFSIVLGIAEGRGRFDQMSLPRFAGWGAVGGGLLSIPFVVTGVVAAAA